MIFQCLEAESEKTFAKFRNSKKFVRFTYFPDHYCTKKEVSEMLVEKSTIQREVTVDITFNPEKAAKEGQCSGRYICGGLQRCGVQ